MARVVFLGTPDFAVPTLKALMGAPDHDVVGVVTQPDRRAGRGRHVRMPPVKRQALEGDDALSKDAILQPRRLRDDRQALERLADLRADVFILAAYGQILPQEVLDVPPHGCIGVHASLLPAYRGAAPVTAAILNGEERTGISLMLTDAGMDTGAIIAQRDIPIAPEDTTETLTARLAQLGAEMVIEFLPLWLAGQITPRPQDEEQASYAPRIEKSAGAIDWRDSAAAIERQIRAYTPWPGSYCHCDGKRFKIMEATSAPYDGPARAPGTVVRTEDDAVGVVTGDGLLLLERVQLAGKRAMDIGTFARGRRDLVGSCLESVRP